MSSVVDQIVISGMAVEAPGGIDTLSAFWTAIAESRELIGSFPRNREWPVEQLLSLHRTQGWSRVADAGGFLSGATEFDPMFFGITPREAISMDPQQRVALRVAWRALENAGINPGELDGADAGCFMGASINEYGPPAAAVTEYSGYRATGSALGAVAGRISHNLGLVGPSLTTDTACASSLTALHLAASALRAGECDWALAGGVCVMGSPAAFFEFAKNHALATDGHCRSYAADATGTLWGEGAGVVVLENESRARALGHRVYGRLLASRVNHNGKGAPIAVPSVSAQCQLIEKTLSAAGIRPDDIGLVEGHGTGTPVGDPLELTALAKVYGAVDRVTGSARLGSVKSNVGHAQAAAGILGLIKMLLAGANGQIPASLHTDRPTAEIDWDATSIRLAAALEPWEPVNDTRFGAVSSFGVAGTNAHAILAMPVLEDLDV
ncbi:polyketide synthase [Nocardia sp. NBC_01499]|uniref:beta-ketoacyl [acyl carrier protein] synthase domain-containing protein n=1 Tax=Nocardia sp. NBC_01499 TaxID=2903597 RepID=UPI00386EA797